MLPGPTPATHSRDLLTWARELWAALAGGAEGFVPGTAKVVVSPASGISPPRWSAVVVLGDAALVTVPDESTAERMLRVLPRTTIDRLTDSDGLPALLPVAGVLGPAALFYLDPSAPGPSGESRDVRRRPRGDAGLAALLARSGETDADESAMEDITSPAFVQYLDGEVVAAAGYRTWPWSVAHLSVLVDPRCRNEGRARAVAAAAVRHALDAGLRPQWRARSVPSQHVARSLGFQRLGAQLSLLPADG
ncbi:GNAT family N-acetyltransferase [Streptomyces coerulescens]|uniref:GNAT family N-acetyltransferase n=1 Tax=Streptomyces coerulescens TaxID=29304 RepID=A0ABW0CV44_STRCD